MSGKCWVRRALKKQIGGVVSVHVPRTNQQIRAGIKPKISSRKFNLGTPLLDNEYTKIVLTSEEILNGKYAEFQQGSTYSKKSALKVPNANFFLHNDC